MEEAFALVLVYEDIFVDGCHAKLRVVNGLFLSTIWHIDHGYHLNYLIFREWWKLILWEVARDTLLNLFYAKLAITFLVESFESICDDETFLV